MAQQLTLVEISLLNGSAINISTACKFRANTFLNNIPPIRYTPPNPYPESTQKQLDMRRKCEIFKYAGSGSSQQTNSMSKKQQYSKIMNNVNIGTRGTQYTCTQDRTLPTLTTACDVPGPIEILICDPNVNLYNYSFQINSRVFPSAGNEDDLLGMNSTS